MTNKLEPVRDHVTLSGADLAAAFCGATVTDRDRQDIEASCFGEQG